MSGRHGKKHNKKRDSHVVPKSGQVEPQGAEATEPQQGKPDQALQATHENPMKWSRKPDPFDLALLGLILTALVAVIYFFQLRSMQDSVELSRKALEVAERPWVSVEAVPSNDLAFVNGKQAVLGLKFSIKNVGKSIAKGVQIDVKMFPTSVGLPVGLDAAAKQRELCDHPQQHPVEQFDLFPVDQPAERVLSISVLPSAVEQAAAYPAGDKSRSFVGFYVVGCVSYRFSFGTEIHQTRFAYHFLGPFPEGKPLVLQDGKPILAGFEVGVTAPKDQLGMMQEMLAMNDAN
jgi:hypothetical protein